MAARALSGTMVVRTEVRTIDQRAEPRSEGLVDCATLHFRGLPMVVPVMNISSRGAMIESDIVPRLGESVVIEFEGCSRLYAFVRWVREGKVGLNFGGELLIG